MLSRLQAALAPRRGEGGVANAPAFAQSAAPEPQSILLDEWCSSAVDCLETLLQDSCHCPHFLPRCKAVILVSTRKAGFGVGMEHGTGLLLARLPPGGRPAWEANGGAGHAKPLSLRLEGSPRSALDDSELHSPGSGGAAAGSGAAHGAHAAASAGASSAVPPFAYGWSAPCCVSLTGLSAGLTAGVHQATHLIGIMSDAALERLEQGGTVALGAEWSVCLLERESDCTASYADLCLCTLIHGLMVDVNVNSTALRVDNRRNRRAYGRPVAAPDLLRGAVLPPPSASALALRLCEAEGKVVAAAFDPSSHAGSEALGWRC